MEPIGATGAGRRRGLLLAAAAAAVVLIVVGASYSLGLGPFAHPSGGPQPGGSAGGFFRGQAVTLQFSRGFVCTPSLGQLYPQVIALNATTRCEMGDAEQGAISDAHPQWFLVPAFAGLTVFGDERLGANSRGFPEFNGSTVPTDCAGGSGALQCPQTPTVLYAPPFSALETTSNLTGGVDGLPLGLLPTPAHDILVNTTADPSVPIPWGTIVVLVFDPNIFPDRTNGACAATVASNLTIPTGHCLTTLTALDRAAVTASTAVPNANGGSTNNSLWRAFGSPIDQVYVVNDFTEPAVDAQLDSNLYQTYGVSPTLPVFSSS